METKRSKYAKRSQLRLESLESRCLFASDWQNHSLPLDVDGSSEVNSLDVLVLVNYLNRANGRPLDRTTRVESDPFLDVNGDTVCSSLDALAVINAINTYAKRLPIVVGGISPNSDRNNNGVVQVDEITISGQTLAESKVEIYALGEAAPKARSHADLQGNFQLPYRVEYGLQTLHVVATDVLGRQARFDLEVRRGNAIHDFNAAALNVVRQWSGVSNDPYFGRIVPSQPPLVARNLAMIQTAMFDAANAVSGTYKGYATQVAPLSTASPEAAAASAAFEVAKALYSEPDEIAIWQASLEETFATIPNTQASTAGKELGRQVARTILTMRANDGSKAVPAYESNNELGHWNRTYPDYLPPLLAQWPNVTPFVMASASDYRPAPPPTLDSAAYAQAVDEVMRLGSVNSSERTEDQTEIAAFWADGAGTATPPGHWNRIATDVTLAKQTDLLDTARTFSLLNLAMADAGIASWETKYHYDLWRPIDAIRQADQDGNASTNERSDWLPLLKTPPFPTYTSGHSTFSGAASTVMAALFGDATSFVDTSDSHGALEIRPLATHLIKTRRFDSFSQAAEEAGMSRIYGGIHFSFDNTAGLDAGRKIAQAVLSRLT